MLYQGDLISEGQYFGYNECSINNIMHRFRYGNIDSTFISYQLQFRKSYTWKQEKIKNKKIVSKKHLKNISDCNFEFWKNISNLYGEKHIYTIKFPVFSRDFKNAFICIDSYSSWEDRTSFGCNCSEFEKINGKWELQSHIQGVVE